jgi:hypothetical protein
MGKPLLHERIRGRQEAYALNMLVQGEKTLYKASCTQTEGQEDGGAHVKTTTTEKPAAGQRDTKL